MTLLLLSQSDVLCQARYGNVTDLTDHTRVREQITRAVQRAQLLVEEKHPRAYNNGSTSTPGH
jgi:hypothetical protein